jgi:hypothetical protein
VITIAGALSVLIEVYTSTIEAQMQYRPAPDNMLFVIFRSRRSEVIFSAIYSVEKSSASTCFAKRQDAEFVRICFHSSLMCPGEKLANIIHTRNLLTHCEIY